MPSESQYPGLPIPDVDLVSVAVATVQAPVAP